MSDEEVLLAQLQETRRNFLALVAELRPELHRYCARMTDSIADGEDVAQDARARAYYESAPGNGVTTRCMAVTRRPSP